MGEPATDQSGNEQAGQASTEQGSLLAGEGQAAPQGEQKAQGSQEAGQGKAQAGQRLDFVLEKYRAEGRSEQDAALEQAKAYVDMEKKFGAFTGAPEAYEFKVSDELIEQGVNIADDDPLLEQARVFAKESNMSQAGFTNMVNLYVEQQLADQKALVEMRANEMKALGANAGQRINNINQFIGARFDEATVKAIQGMAISSEAVGAIEQMIQQMQGAPMGNNEETTTAPGVTRADVEEMLHAKDENGNFKINTDPEHKARYLKARDQLWGQGEFREMING